MVRIGSADRDTPITPKARSCLESATHATSHHHRIRPYPLIWPFPFPASTDPSLSSWSHDLNAANYATLSRIHACLPFISPTPSPSPTQCTPAILAVILSVNWWLDLTLLGQGDTGECVWLRTISETARSEGVSFLSVYHEDYAGMMRIYRALPDVM